MMYRVSGYLTISVTKDIEADSEDGARALAQALQAPSLCHQCSDSGSDDADSWELNGFDDPPEDSVNDVTAVSDEEE